MRQAIFDPDEHEPLGGNPWSESKAREFVLRIIRETDCAYDAATFWPRHPEDASGNETTPLRGIYNGAAGTMWALVRLANRYDVALEHDYADGIGRCETSYREDPRETGTSVPSYFLGSAGIMTARYALTGDSSVLDRLDRELRSNVGNPAREALWGSPGTALAILSLRERRAIARFDGILREIQDELWSTWRSGEDDAAWLWEQDLYGSRRFFVGAAHGAIGNLAPFVRGSDLLTSERKRDVFERVAAMLERYMLRDGDASNWLTLAHPPEHNRMQWCHGAPGVILGLTGYPIEDDRIERMLVAGGEGIWRAGPVRKGPTLCHGTAGNGYAFLSLAQRTGDNSWLYRARAFAMHAIAQVASWRTEFGMASPSLWTGDLGVALFVDAVLRRDPGLLSFDAL